MGLVWGASFLFMKVALDGVSFAQIAWSREILGALTLGIVMLVGRHSLPRDPIVYLHFVVIALTNAVIPHLLFAWAEQHVSSGLAAIYNSLTPIATAVLVAVAFRVEKLNRSQIVGVGVGLVGCSRNHRAVAVHGPQRRPVGAARLHRRSKLLRRGNRMAAQVHQPSTDRWHDGRVHEHWHSGGHHAPPHARTSVRPSAPHLPGRRFPRAAGGVGYRTRLHLEHRRAARVGSNECVDGDLPDSGGRCCARISGAWRDALLA